MTIHLQANFMFSQSSCSFLPREKLNRVHFSGELTKRKWYTGWFRFVRFDVMGLREQLLTLFITDIIRRLVAETVIPWIKKYFVSKNLKKKKFERNSPEEMRYSAILEVNK